MEESLVSLYEDGKTKELQDKLKNVQHKELKEMLDSRILRRKGDACALMRALFAGSPSECTDGLDRRMYMFRHCIKLLQTADLSAKVASKLVSSLMIETDSLPSESLASLTQLFVDSIKSGSQQNPKCLELLPKLLSALNSCETVQRDEGCMSGTEYTSHVLNSLCTCKWSSASVLQLACMFKDVPMSQTELLFVINKVLRMMHHLDLQEIPPLVYQLLLLSAKGHKKPVLEGISRFFVHQDREYKRQVNQSRDIELSESTSLSEHLHQVEGTCLLHINFAMKQDQDLAREFVKYLKNGSPTEVIAPFNIALLLCLAKIQRFQEQVYDFLKVSVLRCFKDTERRARSQWLRDVTPEICDVGAAILDTVYNSTCGWDQVVQGLVPLGFTLMDAFAPRGAFGKPVDSKPTCDLTPTQHACALGARLLTDTFKAHKMVRSEILDQILNRVVTKTSASSTHYLDLLAEIVLSYPQMLLDHLTKLKEAFDYLCYLSPPTAHGLIRAVTPLMKISMSLKDSLLLVLRKAIFSRQVEARVIAVQGFAALLKHFRLQGSITCSQASQSLPSISSSQVLLEAHAPHRTSSEALCLEILGNLRRSFTQQAQVRTTLYESLYEVLCRNTRLGPQILALLRQQWLRYYVPGDDVQPPVTMTSCVMTQGDSVTVAEPLAHLLSSLVQCMLLSRKLNDEEEDMDTEEGPSHATSALDEIAGMLNSLKTRFIAADLEDFELDKSADFSVGTGVGVKNTIRALLVSDMCEVLIEYAFTTDPYKTTSCQAVLALFDKHARLQSMLKQGGGASGSKKARSNNNTAVSRLSLKFLTLLLKAYISDVTPAHQEALNVLRSRDDVFKHLLSAALHKLREVHDKGKCEGPEGHLPEKLFKYTCTLAKVLLVYYSDDIHGRTSSNKDKSRVLGTLCLEGFLECVHIACLRYRDQLPDFLLIIDENRDSEAGDNVEDIIHHVVKKFQRLMMSALSDTSADESGRVKDAEHLLHVIGRLSRCLPPSCEHYGQQLAWLRKLCVQQNIGDTSSYSLTTNLLTLLIEMTSQQKSVASLLIEIARDLHTKMGDIDQDVEIEEEMNLAIISNESSAQHVVSLLLGSVERELEQVQWVMSRLSGEVLLQSESDDVLTQRENQEKSVCSKLGHFVNVFHELVQSAIPAGTHTEQMLKYLTSMYAALSSLVKFYIMLYQNKLGHMCARFEKLVKHSATNLTPYVYAMITYIQATQNEGIQQASGKRKHGKKVSAADVLGKSRIMKETRSIPGLIFAIEQYERYLIQLTKRSKVDLMEHFKMSTSRDFRIQAEVLNEVLDAQNQDVTPSDEEDGEDNLPDETNNDSGSGNESGNDENREPPAKKTKTQPNQVKGKKSALARPKKRSSVY